MFGRIVEICIDRILARLRSRHARRTRRTIGKPCLPTQLLEAVNRCARFHTGKKSKADLQQQVTREAEKLAKAFELVATSLEGESRQSRLMNVLECASQCDITALSKNLHNDRSLDPSLRSHLPKAVPKLARYFDLSRYLINAARTERHSLFRNIRFVAVRHPAFHPQHLVGPFRPL